jgi:hypothetical protein
LELQSSDDRGLVTAASCPSDIRKCSSKSPAGGRPAYGSNSKAQMKRGQIRIALKSRRSVVKKPVNLPALGDRSHGAACESQTEFGKVPVEFERAGSIAGVGDS